ncbi:MULTISPECIES: serine hydrolase domain-containing protein [unclassified Massilia]|uniref:serine hydrolase domain-containing protein n=1 Tax=unclassified Massilia TaxID=2609279 RepID=UPI001E34E76E|nr:MULTISPECIES: serine hydrolase domain-containing protein [unclassified Massilia]
MTMNRARRLLLGMGLLGATGPLLAAPPRRLDGELAAIAADPACELASLSVLAIRAGQVSYAYQCGRRFIGHDGLPDKNVGPDTLFRIASISKMMTTLGLMRLLEDGKVSLDADVSGYLGFTLRNPHFPGQSITLRHLLTHTSSLRDDAGYSWGADVALKDVIDARMFAANAGPGAYFTYCNLGWGVIGTVMERVTGERFDRLMQRLLVEPLGLQAGYLPSELPPKALANLATLYRKRTVDTEVWDPAGPWIAQVDDYSVKPPVAIDRYVIGTNATPFSPTGGLRISARDMGVVMRMLMGQGPQLLKPATLSLMFSRQWTYDGRNGDTSDGLFHCWGLGNEQFPDETGIRLVEGGGFPAVGHLGDAYGLMSVFAFDPKRRNGMIVLVGGTSTDPFALANKGKYSSLARFQECILTALYRGAIMPNNSA